MASTRTALALGLLALCAGAEAGLRAPESWGSALYADHPLVGRIWDARAGRFAEPDELMRALRGADYLLLGEKHDNPDHHALQLAVVRALIDEGRLAQLAFEMMDAGMQARLDALPPSADLAGLKRGLRWDDGGWDWDSYGPLIEAGHRAGVRLTAANMSREALREVHGGAPLPPGAAGALDAADAARLAADIDESHCGMLPASQLPAMVRVQRARDFAMADSLRPPPPSRISALVAGNYHVRRDLGVPRYLPEGTAVSLSFLEVRPGEADPAAHLERPGAPEVDYVWFTPVVSEEDYCAALR